jgi:hypothetical protein
MAEWRPEQVVFVDESGVNSGSGTRTHGWGPKGRIIPYPVLFQNRGNFSILPAMTMNGYIVTEVYAGAVNADTFNAFVEHQLIPALRAEDPDREWIIVMDNATIHKSDVHLDVDVD